MPVFGREFVIGELEKIAEGLPNSVIGIDYVNQYIQDGSIEREEVIPYLQRAFEVIKDKSVPKGCRKKPYSWLFPRANIHVPEGYTWSMVEQAINGLETIKKGKPVHYRGHVI